MFCNRTNGWQEIQTNGVTQENQLLINIPGYKQFLSCCRQNITENETGRLESLQDVNSTIASRKFHVLCFWKLYHFVKLVDLFCLILKNMFVTSYTSNVILRISECNVLQINLSLHFHGRSPFPCMCKNIKLINLLGEPGITFIPNKIENIHRHIFMYIAIIVLRLCGNPFILGSNPR